MHNIRQAKSRKQSDALEESEPLVRIPLATEKEKIGLKSSDVGAYDQSDRSTITNHSRTPEGQQKTSSAKKRKKTLDEIVNTLNEKN